MGLIVKLTLLLLACWGLTAGAAPKKKAPGRKSKCAVQLAAVSPLDKTSLEMDDNVELPKRVLVRLLQKDASDPFGIFDEGLDPENENPLFISNEEKLEISFAGWNYESGRDGANRVSVVPLRFSESEQRYLIEVSGSYSYQLIVNVDRTEKLGRVWMREKKSRRWSGWAEVASYWRGPSAPGSKPAAQSGAEVKPQYQGCVGDGQRGPQLIAVRHQENGPLMVIYWGNHELSGVALKLSVPDDLAALLGSGDYRDFQNERVFTAKTGERVAIRVDGSDFAGRPRIRIDVTATSGERFVLQSCTPWNPARLISP